MGVKTRQNSAKLGKTRQNSATRKTRKNSGKLGETRQNSGYFLKIDGNFGTKNVWKNKCVVVRRGKIRKTRQNPASGWGAKFHFPSGRGRMLRIRLGSGTRSVAFENFKNISKTLERSLPRFENLPRFEFFPKFEKFKICNGLSGEGCAGFSTPLS